MSERRRGYAAYLLRLWQTQDEGEIGCRVSLENAHTGETLAFAHLDGLVAFLRERIGLAAAAEHLVEHRRMPETDSVREEGGSE